MNTINVLLENNYIPIINENDTVATDEIKFGDNDKLAALTGALLEVDLVIIATNTDGIYTKDSMNTNSKETIKVVNNIEDLHKEVADNISKQGTGGMRSKIDAASILNKEGIETWVVNGLNDNFIFRAMNGEIPITKILKKG